MGTAPEAAPDSANAAAPEEPAPAAVAAGVASSDGWAAAWDPASQKWYYYNSLTGAIQWDPPPSWVPNGEADAAAEPPAPAWRGPGYYYTDAHGVDQGPFSKEQLVGWRGALPMDLPVWREESDPAAAAGGPEKEEEKKEEEEDVDTAALDKDGNDGKGEEKEEEEGGAAAAGAGAGGRVAPRREAVPLAEVLGDDALLADWCGEHPEAAGASCAAPSAAAFERLRAGGTAASLAEAVVAGLPPTDEAAALARAAAAQGQSLHDVVAWNRAQAPPPDYAVTAMHQGRMGRLTAPGARESIYADLGRYMDPRTMEAQMAAARERGRRKLTPAEVAEARRRKKAKKEEKQKNWLLAD